MRLAKQAVAYYTAVTGNKWSQFYDRLDESLALPLETQTGETWLIHALMNTILKSGITLDEFKQNKDAVKAIFDEDGRKQAGEFFTPVVWAEELHRYMDKYIPNWRTDFNVWEGSCYSMDTELLTKRGWIKYSDLRNDDLVFAYDKLTNTVKWCGIVNHFVKKTKRLINFVAKYSTGGSAFYDEIMSDCLVTEDHTMWYYEDGVLISSSALEFYEKLKESFYVTVDKVAKKYEVLSYDRNIDNQSDACVIRLPISYSSCMVIEEEQDVWDITMEDYHIFLTRRNNHPIFSSNCGSGNLIRTAKITPEHLFASTLQEDDVTLIRNTPELAGCTAFQCDFLSDIDYEESTEFLDKLPPRLKEIIQNDEPLVILMNPPYKSGSAKATDVGSYMISQSTPEVNLAKPAYDIFYQFCWRVMHFVEMFNLHNCYYCFFGPLTFFTGAGANILLKEFERSFEFVDGMCISAQEFSDTSDSILWGIGASIWKSMGNERPVYDSDGNRISYHKDVLLDKKFLIPGGGIGCEGKVLYEPPRQKLSEWVVASDLTFSVDAPLMTSHLTFKGREVFEKIAPMSGKLDVNALGTLMVGNTLTRSADQGAVLSMPTTIQYVSITEENFWRCVASYTFRRVFDAGWAIAKKEISAPNPNVEGYDLWVRNALVMFLFEYKSMMSSLRNVEWKGEKVDIVNKLFFLSEDEIREHCHDEVILADLDAHPLQNQFMLKMIAESEPYWVPEVRQLYDWCKAYTLATYDLRKTVNYKGSLECADAGFQQLRSGGLWKDELSAELTKIVVQARDYLRKGVDKFGFVSEIESDDI